MLTGGLPVQHDQPLHGKPTLVAQYGVTDLALFGSMVHDTAGVGSGLDILVFRNGSAISERFFGIRFFLEDLLGRSVDLITDFGVRPGLRPFIEAEAVHV